jgi:hypothetical protein
MKRISMSIKLASIMAAVVATIPAAHAQVPCEIEGPISAVEDNLDGTGTITVMGMTIQIPATAVITTPTTTLTMAQLADPSPLPGRTQAGFIGGTAIVVGTVPAGGQVTAESVFTEPAENVVLGVITSNAPDPLTVNNVPIVLLSDSRMPAGPPLNDLGIAVALDDLPLGTTTAIGGYFDGANFQAFSFEAGGGAAAEKTPLVGITRAAGRNGGGRLEVRGGLTGISGDQTLELRNGNTDQVLAVLTAAEIPLDGVAVLVEGTAVFRFRVKGLGSVPTTVKVVNLTSPSKAIAEVAIR